MKPTGTTRSSRPVSSNGKSAPSSYDNALSEYVSGEGMWINDYLRGRYDFGELSAQERQYLSDLDKATSQPLGKDYDLFRAVDASAVFGSISDIEYENLKSSLVYGNTQRLVAESARKSLSKAVGERIEKGFMSATTSQNVADSWGGFTGAEHPIVLKFRAAKNIKGRSLEKFDVKGDEQNEVLLGKGQRYKIGKVYGKNGNIYVDVKLI